MAEHIAVDIETTGLDFTKDTITSLAFWGDKHRGVLTNIDAIRDWVNQYKDSFLIFHNGKFDVKVIRKQLGVNLPIGFDTLLAESILPDRPESLTLETCVSKELGFPSWKDKSVYKAMGEGTATHDAVSSLNLTDVEYTYRLYKAQLDKLQKYGLLDFYLFSNLGVKTLNFLADIEYRGIGFDYQAMEVLWKENLKQHEILTDYLYTTYGSLVKEYEEEQLLKHPLTPPSPTAKESTKQKYAERVAARKEKYKFNFGSSTQVVWLLKEKLGFPCKDLKGKTSTSKDVLEFYRGHHPIIEDLLKLRNNEHDHGSFFQNWHDYYRAGSLHPSYRMDTARTFRLSCTEPALQQVKRDGGMRSLFVPREGYKLAVVDYSMIEPRIIAHYSRDPVLCEIFKSDMDLYYVVAKEVMNYGGTPESFKTSDKETRAVAKEIALSSFYGIGPDKFAYRIRLKTGRQITSAEAKRYLDRYFDLLSGVREFRVNLVSHLESNPLIQTIMGRPLYFKSSEFYHLAFNKLIQCTGSDINLVSQLDLNGAFQQSGINAHCVHLVHDEALFEYHPSQESQVLDWVEYYMATRYAEAPWSLSVPIKVEIKTGNSWAVK